MKINLYLCINKNKIMSKTRLQKFDVCPDCFSVGITYANCNCMEGKYIPIELEFEVCECCNNLIDDGNPVDNEFNENQLKKYAKDN